MALLEKIFAHASASPARTALIHNQHSYSYQALVQMVAHSQAHFAELKIPEGATAVVCIQDLLAAWVVGLALRRLGITTVIVRSLEDLGAPPRGPCCMVTTPVEAGQWPRLSERAAEWRAPVLLAPADMRDVSSADLAIRPAASLGAHILLTSGTTGDSKMVLIDGDAEDRIAVSNAELAHIEPDMTLHLFDFGGWTAAGYFWPVCAWTLGGAVALQQGRPAWEGLASLDASRRHVAFATPQIVQRLLAAPVEIALPNPALRLIAVGGMLSLAQWSEARTRLTADLWSIYGATETALMTFTQLRTGDDLLWHQVNPGCDLQIVGPDDRPLPNGQIGAVRARPTRVDSYLDDPVASAAFFRDGYFYTGDTGVLGDDRRLRLHGRTTDVINVLGSKYGVLPIEAALRDALSVADVCVFSLPGPAGEDVHVALETDVAVPVGLLRASLQAALPGGVGEVRAHKVERFPRNAMGKLERGRLIAQLALSPSDSND